MTHFLLIAIFFSGGGTVSDVGTITGIEFDNKQACEVARAVVHQHMDRRAVNQTELICVPKS